MDDSASSRYAIDSQFFPATCGTKRRQPGATASRPMLAAQLARKRLQHSLPFPNWSPLARWLTIHGRSTSFGMDVLLELPMHRQGQIHGVPLQRRSPRQNMFR